MLRIREDVNKLIVLFILILHWLAASVLATHFRGGIIMVRPVDGGAPAEVNYKQHSSYNHRLCGVHSSVKVHVMSRVLRLRLASSPRASYISIIIKNCAAPYAKILVLTGAGVMMHYLKV